MGVFSLFALSASLRLLVTASQASSLDNSHVLLPAAQANAVEPAENLAAVHPFVAQDLEDRGFRTSCLLDAIDFVLDITRLPKPSTTALRGEDGEVERFILSHLPAESDKLPGVMVMHRDGPVDFRFTGELYERACELPMIETPAFARLYDELVESIGPYAALRQLQYRPGGPWQVTAVHNEMLQQAQFASWFRAAQDPKLLEEAATIDNVELPGHPTKPKTVAELYNNFINRVLALPSPYKVRSQENSIFADFQAGEHEIACKSILSKQAKLINDLRPYRDATTTLGVEDPKVLGLQGTIEELMFGIWFRVEIDPIDFKNQRLNPSEWLKEKWGETLIDRYKEFIERQLTGARKLINQHLYDVDALNDPKRQRIAY